MWDEGLEDALAKIDPQAKLDRMPLPKLSSAKLEELWNKAHEKVVTRRMVEEIENRYDNPTDQDYDEMPRHIAAMIRAKKAKTETLKSTHVFLTINPPPGKIELKDFVRRVRDMLNNKEWITESYVTFEQRGDTPETMGVGFHAHCLFNRGVIPSQVKKQCKDNFRRVMDVDNPALMNFQWRWKDDKVDGIKTALDYLNGIKADPDKRDKTILDVEWRELNDLEGPRAIPL